MSRTPQHLELAVTVLTYFVEKVKGKKFDVGAFLRKPEIMYCTNSRNAVKLEEVVYCEPIMPYWEEAVKASEVARAVNIPTAPVIPTVPSVPPSVPPIPEVKKGKK